MHHMTIPFRELKLAPPDASGGVSMSFEGYGAVFNNVDAYGDIIEPGAFAQFLSDVTTGKQEWPSMLLQHGGWGMTAEDMTPIGVWTELAEDGKGLKVAGKLADTPRGREVHSLLKMTPRPALDGLSIGYIPKEWEPRSKPEDPRRRIKRIDLIEISPVTFPANGKARVGSVKALAELGTLSEIEDHLREAGGFSRSEAKGLIARIKSVQPREAVDDIAQLSAVIHRNLSTLKGYRHV